MKNYLRQFVGWAIQFRRSLRYDWQKTIRLELFLYFLTSSVLLYLVIRALESRNAMEAMSLLLNRGELQAGEFALFNFSSNVEVYATALAFGLFLLGAHISTSMAMRTIINGHNDQRRFASVVAHELRTPLSVLKATAEISEMRGGDITPPEVRSLIQGVVTEVDRMSDIIRFFLRFSMRDRGSRLPMTPINIIDNVNSAIRLIHPLAEGANVDVVFENRGSSYIVWGNPIAFEDMLVNLLKNAIHHTPSGGKVKIDVRNKGNGVECIVADTGSGISQTDLPHIFEPFYQREMGRTRKGGIGGVGLGLAIVKDIARMHNAKISVQSTLGRGACFSLVFPHA